MYGDVRGLNAPPRSIVAPASATTRAVVERLLAALDAARPGDQPEVRVADAAPVDLDHGRVGSELARDEPVRLDDRDDLLDAGVALDGQGGEQLAVADRADHRRLAPAGHARVDAGLLEPGDDVVRLVRRRLRAHDDQQLGRAVRCHRAR